MKLPTVAKENAEAEAHPDIERVLIGRARLAEQVRLLGQQITRDYAARGVRELTLVAVANGALIFAADLLREISLHTRFDSIRVSSYLDGTVPKTPPQMADLLRLDLVGRHVLVVDDILDTGNTLSRLCALLQKQGPASLRTCVLLDKKARRQVDFFSDYTGFDIPDRFVVGYGLDFAERYRNLPFIGALAPDKQDPAKWG